MMLAPTLRAALAGATDFVRLATRVCTALDEWYGVPRSAVALHRVDGGPIVLVDNLGTDQDAYRLATVHDARYRGGALDLALRGEVVDPAQFDDLGFVGEVGHLLVLPLHGASHLVGSIHCSRHEPFATDLRCDLATLATQVTARLAQLGVAAVTTRAPRLVHPATGVTRRGALAITRGL